jgi:hypothetical protein
VLLVNSSGPSSRFTVFVNDVMSAISGEGVEDMTISLADQGNQSLNLTGLPWNQ